MRGPYGRSKRFARTARFGDGANAQDLEVNGLSTDAFVAGYAGDGAFQWVRQIVGGRGRFAEAFHVAVDRAGNSYVTGWFDQSATFGPGEKNETTLHEPADPWRSSFVAKYDRLGVFMWAREIDTGGSCGPEHRDPFLSVAELTDGAVLINGDGLPAGVGAAVTPDAGDEVLSPGETITVTFRIRLRTTNAFRFFVTVHGDPAPSS